MRQVREHMPHSYSNTRMMSRTNCHKSQFTASDFEIFSDLNKLDSMPQKFHVTNRILKKVVLNLPQKRKRTTKKVSKAKEGTENDAILALATSILKQTEPNTPLEEKNEKVKKIDQELYERQENKGIFEIGLKSSNENFIAVLEGCRNSALSDLDVNTVQSLTEASDTQMQVV